MRIFGGALLAIVIVLGAGELRRWRSPATRDLLSPAQWRRRALNFASLLLAVAMVFGGAFFPEDHVSRRIALSELVYWSACLLIAVAIPIFAFWEYRKVLRSAQIATLGAERDEAARQIVELVARAEEERRQRSERPHRNGHG